MPYLDITDGMLYYETAGDGETVVFIHGTPSDASQWDMQFDTFVEAFRVVRYDMRGYGHSSVPSTLPYSHAEDLGALLNHLHIERASLVGHSSGGEVSIDFALASPERLNKIVLVDSVVQGYVYSSQWEASWGPVADAIVSGLPEESMPSFFAHPLLVQMAKNPAAKAKLIEILHNYSGWHFRNADPIVFGEPHAMQQLGRIEAPALVMLGLEDAPEMHEIADILSTGLPNAQRADLPDVGHFPPLEIPEEFNRILWEFLEQTE